MYSKTSYPGSMRPVGAHNLEKCPVTEKYVYYIQYSVSNPVVLATKQKPEGGETTECRLCTGCMLNTRFTQVTRP